MALFKRKSDREILELLEESGRNIQRGSLLLRDLLRDFPEKPELARELLLCEQEGDRISHNIIHQLNANRRGGSAFESADVLALTTGLDDIVDYAEEAADLLGLYGVEAVMEQAVDFGEVLVNASEHVANALRGLRSGQDISASLVEINRLENDGDQLHRSALASLFAGGIDPMVVIRWKDIFDSLEDSVDSCEKVAHILEGIQLKLS